jgi:hypothetical protein
MWFPADQGMINLDRVAFIEVRDDLEISFYNDHQAEMTKATFESEKQLRRYLEKLKSELSYPVPTDEHDRFPEPNRAPLLESESGTDQGGPTR